MRLFLDASVVRPPLAGVQLSVRHEALALLAQRQDWEVAVLSHDEVLNRAAAAAGAGTGGLPRAARATAGRILWQQLALPGILRRRGADVLHALAYTAPLRCPVPYALNVHDLIALDHPELCSRLNAWHMRALLPGSVRRAAACIVSSGFVADGVRQRFGLPAARLHRVPLGVEAERFAESAPRPAWVARLTDRPYLLFVGNLEPKKGLATLLESYAGAAERLGCDLLLAGRPAWRCGRFLRQARQYPGPGRIHLPGRVAAADLPGLYQHAWAFVFPSVTEGFGMPVLEAMAAGVPVVHSDHPALVETAGGRPRPCGPNWSRRAGPGPGNCRGRPGPRRSAPSWQRSPAERSATV